jgi:hypothetical protein
VHSPHRTASDGSEQLLLQQPSSSCRLTAAGDTHPHNTQWGGFA